ncbi:MAG: hypothetical protein ACYDAR_07930, partial [Thermomicrobiales bacterium]
MAETPVASGHAATGRRSDRPSVSATRWYGALDAMAPYLIVLIAVAIARHPFASTRPATVAIVGAVVLLAAGAGASFFLDLS